MESAQSDPFPPPGVSTKTILSHCGVFILVLVLANALAVLVLLPLNPLILSEQELHDGISGIWTRGTTDEINLTIMLIYILPFVIPSVISLLYMGPLIGRAFGRIDTVQPRRIINLPIMLSLFGVIGWILPNLSLFFLNEVIPWLRPSWIKFISLNLLLGLFVFVFCYYVLDWFFRRYLVPNYFPGNQLSRIPGAIQLTVPFRFMIFLGAVAVFPAGMLTLAFSGTVTRIGAAGLSIDVGPFYWLLGLVMTLTGVVTVPLARAFQKPLVAMRTAADEIDTGNYTVSVAIVSNDEIGRLGESMNSMTKGLHEKEFIKETFGRAVDPAIRDYLLRGNVELGGENRLATVLFSDIRGFTTILETMAPGRAVQLLNQYFEAMHAPIAHHGGIVNKYIGDAIMALFGVPVEDPSHADHGIQAALAMRDGLIKLNQDLKDEGFPPIRTGIGVHSGWLVAGNIGSKARMEYTVIGDTVNVASRIEGLCKDTGHDLLVSSATKQLLKKDIPMAPLPITNVRGRKEAVAVFSLPK